MGPYADPLDMSEPLAPGDRASGSMPPVQPPVSGPGSGEGSGRVRIILEDGTLAEPDLDPELEERLRYLVDNIVPPSDPSSS